jgi:hypothetical protein
MVVPEFHLFWQTYEEASWRVGECLRCWFHNMAKSLGAESQYAARRGAGYGLYSGASAVGLRGDGRLG